MAKNEYNFEVVIRGKLWAYSKDEIIDRFNNPNPYEFSACYEFMDKCMGFAADYDGKIKVTDSKNKVSVGYYSIPEYKTTIEQVAVSIYKRVMASSLVDLEERIKVYDRAIEALNNASVGWFGDTKQVSDTARSLKVQREFLVNMVATCKGKIGHMRTYSDLPEGSEKFLEYAKEILHDMDGIFMLREPTESDVTTENKNTVKGE